MQYRSSCWIGTEVHCISGLRSNLRAPQNEQSWKRKWKCNLDDLLLIVFMSQKMQLYSEKEKAFLLIHFNWIMVQIRFHTAEGSVST